MTDLQENERIDDLQCNGYKLIQNTACFCFGMDAVLLSSFAKCSKGEIVLDLCTGNGVIPILMCGKTQASHFTAIEIQDTSYELAKRNIMLNELSDRIQIIHGDIKETGKLTDNRLYNVVTCNPPYMNENHGIVNPESAKAIARHEILCSLFDVVKAASKSLKVKGRLYMVHRPSRLVEIFECMKDNKLEPKRIRMVHPYIDKEANMVLIEAVKCGSSQLKTEPPLIVYNSDGTYTEEILKLYGMEGK